MPALRPPAPFPPHRRGALLGAVALAGLAVAGCAQFDAALGQREAVVHFRPQTASHSQLQVRRACSHVPQATPEPLPTEAAAAGGYDIRYRVDHASDADLAKLQQCLQQFPSVVGIEFTSPGGSG